MFKPRSSVRIGFGLLESGIIAAAVLGLATGHAVTAPALILMAAAAASLGALHRVKTATSGDSVVSCSGFRTSRWSRDDIEGFVLSRQPLSVGWVEVVLKNGDADTLRSTKVLTRRHEAEAIRDQLNAWLAPAHQSTPAEAAALDVPRVNVSRTPPEERFGQPRVEAVDRVVSVDLSADR